MVNVFETMRVPGFRSRILGRSLRLISGSRNMVITVALEKSLSYKSALVNVALSVTPAEAALRLDSSTISGLYSIPRARAALRRCDHRTPIARAQIDDVILGRDLGHVEHLVDQCLRGRHPYDVFACLADVRLERCDCGWGLGRDGSRADDQTERQQRPAHGEQRTHK